MLPHISDDLSRSFIEKLEEMLQKYRGETINFDSRKVGKFKGFEFPRLHNNRTGGVIYVNDRKNKNNACKKKNVRC